MSLLIGPLAAFEALAIDDYIRSSQTPILTVAGAEDMTQRKANPWLVRPSCTSAQPSHPLGDYAAKDLKFKRVAVLADDFAFGHENRRRLPARVRGQRRQGRAEAVHAAQRARLRHLYLAAQAEPRRGVSPAMPARTASSSSSSCANTATRRRSSAASRRSTNRCCSRWATTRSAPSPATGIRPSSTTRSTRSSSRRSSATTRPTPASMRPRPISAARCSTTRSRRSAARSRTSPCS